MWDSLHKPWSMFHHHAAKLLLWETFPPIHHRGTPTIPHLSVISADWQREDISRLASSTWTTPQIENLQSNQDIEPTNQPETIFTEPKTKDRRPKYPEAHFKKRRLQTATACMINDIETIRVTAFICFMTVKYFLSLVSKQWNVLFYSNQMESFPVRKKLPVLVHDKTTDQNICIISQTKICNLILTILFLHNNL